jgi:hypothetical protein
LKEKEKESGKKKIKTCTGIHFAFDQNGADEKEGKKYSVETFNHSGNIIQSMYFSLNGGLIEASKFHYDTAQKLVLERKQIPNSSPQKHTFHYNKNGRMDFGKVYMDTTLIHTCSYEYDNKNNLIKIITHHHVSLEKNVPAEEAIEYSYDEKGNMVKETDMEVELNGSELKQKKIISTTQYIYDNNSLIAQSLQYDGKDCKAKTEFHYDADGKLTEEIFYPACEKKPEYKIKYEYQYY